MRLNVFYDDKAKMRDRIARLSSGSAYTEEPISLTARTFAAVQVEQADADSRDRLVVRSNFQLIAYRSGEQRLLGGRYIHRLVRQRTEAFASQRSASPCLDPTPPSDR